MDVHGQERDDDALAAVVHSVVEAALSSLWTSALDVGLVLLPMRGLDGRPFDESLMAAVARDVAIELRAGRDLILATPEGILVASPGQSLDQTIAFAARLEAIVAACSLPRERGAAPTLVALYSTGHGASPLVPAASAAASGDRLIGAETRAPRHLHLDLKRRSRPRLADTAR